MTKNHSQTINRFYIAVFVLFAASILYSACGKKEEPASEKKEAGKQTSEKQEVSKTGEKTSPGKELFYAKSKENNIACADCHSDGTNIQNSFTKYFSDVIGADKRTSTYHGKFKGPAVAANAGGATVCYEAYMKMKSPLTQEQIAALNEYYSGLKGSGEQRTEITYETIALPEKDKAKLKEAQKKIAALTGDPAAGESKFSNACGGCHGEKKFVKKVPDIFDDFDGNLKSITYNVRFGDGAMPFFNEKVLSNQDLADIAAYILKKNSK